MIFFFSGANNDIFRREGERRDKGDGFEEGNRRGCMLGLGQYCTGIMSNLITLGDIDIGREDTEGDTVTSFDTVSTIRILSELPRNATSADEDANSSSRFTRKPKEESIRNTGK